MRVLSHTGVQLPPYVAWKSARSPIPGWDPCLAPREGSLPDRESTVTQSQPICHGQGDALLLLPAPELSPCAMRHHLFLLLPLDVALFLTLPQLGFC